MALKEALMLGCSPDEALWQMDLILEEIHLQEVGKEPVDQAEAWDEQAMDLFDQELHDEISAAFLESDSEAS